MEVKKIINMLRTAVCEYRSHQQYRLLYDEHCVRLIRGDKELWSVAWHAIKEVGFYTKGADAVGWDYFLLLNSENTTFYIAIDPEWEGVDAVIAELSRRIGRDICRYAIANSVTDKSVVAWPDSEICKEFRFLSDPVF